MEQACHKNASVISESIFSSMFSLLNSSPCPVSGSQSVVLPCVRGLTPLPKEELKVNFRKKKLNTSCPHLYRKHYAKNMCNYCYHKNGRNGTATMCPHKDRPVYAKGKCHFCYLQKYKDNNNYKRKRSRRRT